MYQDESTNVSIVSVSRHAGLRRPAASGELDVSGQLNGQLVVRHRNGAVGVAVDDRDRGAPVALPGNQPVPQAIRHRWSADTPLRGISGDGALPHVAATPGEGAAADHHALADVRRVQ